MVKDAGHRESGRRPSPAPARCADDQGNASGTLRGDAQAHLGDQTTLGSGQGLLPHHFHPGPLLSPPSNKPGLDVNTQVGIRRK